MALSHVMAVANIALALALLASIAWRLRARRAGEDALGPFRRTSPLHGPVALFLLLSILSIFFSTDAIRSAREVKGFVTFLLVVLVSGLVDGVEDAHLVVDALRLTTLYLVLGASSTTSSSATTTSGRGPPAGSRST
ncbi:MAG: hypothetical protein IPF66_00610 [Holophagales bacterium]|nr:hypothetical protein [Holophagales bacterium]